VIVTQKMQNTMNEQLCKTLLQGDAHVPGFPESGISGNDHVAQKARRDSGEFTLGHGKGDDVGGAFPSQVLLIVTGDFAVVGDQ
jgi:hypothetical protein